jgi:hypothetical protein
VTKCDLGNGARGIEGLGLDVVILSDKNASVNRTSKLGASAGSHNVGYERGE